MRKLAMLAIAAIITTTALAQTDTVNVSIPTKKLTVSPRPADHLMVQLALNSWSGAPDSIKSHIKGIQRSANVYAMINKPFAGNPKMAVAFGVGIGTSNIYFKKMEANIIGKTSPLQFINTDSTNHFKKYKMTTAYLEVPLELRFTSDPTNPMKAIKAALGIKVGTILSAGTKGKTLMDKQDRQINSYTQKLKAKDYFTSTRLTGTARVGYGPFGVFAAYSFNPVFKDGVAEKMNLIQFGISLTGL